MKTKTYKLGEYVTGGIVKITRKEVKNQAHYNIQLLDYNDKHIVLEQDFTNMNDAEYFLNKHTTSYYAEMIINFKSKK